jgi:hypothetical protein
VVLEEKGGRRALAIREQKLGEADREMVELRERLRR